MEVVGSAHPESHIPAKTAQDSSVALTGQTQSPEPTASFPPRLASILSTIGGLAPVEAARVFDREIASRPPNSILPNRDADVADLEIYLGSLAEPVFVHVIAANLQRVLSPPAQAIWGEAQETILARRASSILQRVLRELSREELEPVLKPTVQAILDYRYAELKLNLPKIFAGALNWLHTRRLNQIGPAIRSAKAETIIESLGNWTDDKLLRERILEAYLRIST